MSTRPTPSATRPGLSAPVPRPGRGGGNATDPQAASSASPYTHCARVPTGGYFDPPLEFVALIAQTATTMALPMADEPLPIANRRPEYYRDLAVILRARSSSLLTAESRCAMADLAEAYDHLAALLDAKSVTVEPTAK